MLDTLEKPLLQSVKMYQDKTTTGSETDMKKKEAFKEVWNVIQRDVRIVRNKTVPPLITVPTLSDEMLRGGDCQRLEERH